MENGNKSGITREHGSSDVPGFTDREANSSKVQTSGWDGVGSELGRQLHLSASTNREKREERLIITPFKDNNRNI